jgi:hypothetical protein
LVIITGLPLNLSCKTKSPVPAKAFKKRAEKRTTKASLANKNRLIPRANNPMQLTA